MRKKGRSYPNPNNSRKSKINIHHQSERPTEYRNPGQNEQLVDQSSYQNVGRKLVPSEKSKGNRLADILKEWGAVLAGVAIISGFSIWAASLQFRVDNTENKVKDHKSIISSNSEKIGDVEKLTIGISKDISHLKEDQKKFQTEIKDLNSIIVNENYTSK